MGQLKPGDQIHGFVLKSITDLEEYRGKGYTFEHGRTGLQLFHLFNDDEDNLFSFAFKTPVSDDTGVAHILEHSVLSGSRNYPVKDPFMALIKGSMNTFINAMTYPDKTIYPASSPVEKDYFNIMGVYADAVFFPLLKEEVFRQEGHRLEFDEEGKLKITGIVYNEMKGVYSNHDSIAAEWSIRSLFPDTGYRNNSGGDPESIPDLTYDQFVKFHDDYYHPSNCRVFLYGNIPTEKQLEFLSGNYLGAFRRKNIHPEIEKQPRWKEKRVYTIKSPLSPDESAEGKSSILINWLTEEVSDPVNLLTLEVISEILLGNQGSPLYKAIVDSGLGSDVSPVSGLETDIREFVFSVGLRGTDPDKQEAFEDLVYGILQKLSEQGIDKDTAEGALKRIEFRNREIRGGAPAGLRLMDKTLRGWLHGYPPELTLEFTRWMEKIKKEFAADPLFFEKYIRLHLVDNPHRSVVVVQPDKEYTRQIAGKEEERISLLLKKLTPADLDVIREQNRRLAEFQNTPDTPEAVATIPLLSRSDLPDDISIIKTENRVQEDISVFIHDLYTNGIVYIDFGFDTGGLSIEDHMYLPLLGKMITSSALPGIPYDRVAQLFTLHTGGFYSFLESSSNLKDRNEIKNTIFFRLKFLREELQKALEISFGMFADSLVDDASRLKDIILEMKGDFTSSIVPSGHSYAALRAGSKLNTVLAFEEKWRGLEQFVFISFLAENLTDEKLKKIGEKIRSLRQRIFSKDNVAVNISASGDEIERILPEVIRALKDKLPLRLDFPKDGENPEPGTGLFESVVIPASVGFVSTSLNASFLENRNHAAELLLSHILKTEYLWETVRMKGGAYGASASANGMEGLFTFASYRDPGISGTLESYREGLSILAKKTPDDDTVEKAVIAVVGRDVRPLSPGEKSIIGFRRTLYGIDDTLRRQKRGWLLDIRGEELSRAAERLLEAMKHSSTVVLAGEDSIHHASLKVPGLADTITKLPG